MPTIPGGQVRIYGDPFAADACASGLRRFLALALRSGFEVALDLTVCDGDPRSAHQVLLTDGSTLRSIRTAVQGAERVSILDAAETIVHRSAPCVVFGDPDTLRQAGLQYPDATELLFALDQPPDVLLAQLPDPTGRPWSCVQSHLARTAKRSTDPSAIPSAKPLILHLLDQDPQALRLVCEALGRLGPTATPALELVLFGPDADTIAARTSCAGIPVRGGMTDDIRHGLCYLQPWRSAPRIDDLRTLLGSGCPVVLSRWSATAAAVPAPGLCLPIGGRISASSFEPNLDHMVAVLRRLLSKPSEGAAVGERARRHVLSSSPFGSASQAHPKLPASEADGERPVVVLEAPLFQVDSSSVLTLATARALRRRGLVDLHLVPTRPEIGRYADLRAVAPDLAPYLTTRPPAADLWLSAGWPPRADRPVCRRFAVRFDYEYGALPADLQPLLTDEVDHVVVHSNAVARILQAAGTPASRIVKIPHGVEACFRPEGECDPEVEAFGQGAITFLFVGGLIWRKGIDLLLQAWLTAFRGQDVRLVVKAGGQSRYQGFELDALVRRCAGLKGAPPILLLDQDMTTERLAAVYRSCDVLVHPYRGEGFCLPVLEARASGLPVVVTAGGATDDFCQGEACLKVSATTTAVPLPELHLQQPFVLDPDPASLRVRLMQVVQDLPALQRAARQESVEVRASYRWDVAAAALEALAGASRAGRSVVTGRCRRSIRDVRAQGGSGAGR